MKNGLVIGIIIAILVVVSIFIFYPESGKEIENNEKLESLLGKVNIPQDYSVDYYAYSIRAVSENATYKVSKGIVHSCEGNKITATSRYGGSLTESCSEIEEFGLTMKDIKIYLEEVLLNENNEVYVDGELIWETIISVKKTQEGNCYELSKIMPVESSIPLLGEKICFGENNQITYFELVNGMEWDELIWKLL